jgi:hypothetical protein
MVQCVPAVPLTLFSLFSVAAIGFALAARAVAARAIFSAFRIDGWCAAWLKWIKLRWWCVLWV